MVSFKASLLVVAALAVSTTARPVSQSAAADCADVHIISARGSTEAVGEGSISAIVDSIVSGSKQTITREAIVYPATLTDYTNSQSKGVTAMKAQLAAKASACPNTKIVLTGYSQGAHIAGDILAAKASGSANGTLGIVVYDIDKDAR
ncbi:hypothetical protein H0H81_009291 [Sphagnurus paluster]|uniref:Cutinase n=1 Tax=Sphagnurus paluster TaxID=117069 RepID=A0A9P7GNM3_9AGAR|nr:hypothetical protein H0H81_009291 [Sphagnurus paluster]